VDEREFENRSTLGAKDSFLPYRLQTGSQTDQISYSLIKEITSPWVKRSGRDAENSTPSKVEIKNIWSYTSTPLPCQGQSYLSLSITHKS